MRIHKATVTALPPCEIVCRPARLRAKSTLDVRPFSSLEELVRVHPFHRQHGPEIQRDSLQQIVIWHPAVTLISPACSPGISNQKRPSGSSVRHRVLDLARIVVPNRDDPLQFDVQIVGTDDEMRRFEPGKDATQFVGDPSFTKLVNRAINSDASNSMGHGAR